MEKGMHNKIVQVLEQCSKRSLGISILGDIQHLPNVSSALSNFKTKP